MATLAVPGSKPYGWFRRFGFHIVPKRLNPKPFVLTTHDLAEAERLCDRIALINDGRVMAEGTPNELKTMVQSDYGKDPTLENVFMTFTGKSLDDDIDEENENENDE